MARRRSNGEGTVDRHHNHPSCPAPVNGVRPKHRCQGPYRIRLTVTVDGLPKRKVVYGKTLAEAQAKADDVKAADKAGQAVVGRALTVAQWFDHYLAVMAAQWKPNTLQVTRRRLATWVLPYLGHLRLDRLTPEHVEQLYVAMRKAGRAEGTVRQVHVLLRHGLKLAVNHGKVSRNVTDRVQAPSTHQGERDGMSLDEAYQVLAAAGDNPRWHVALLCGLRQGEALALRWLDVYLDADQPHLVVRQSVCRIAGQGSQFVTPKSAASKDRVVPLMPAVANRLRVLKAQHLAKGWGLPDDLVFSTGKRTVKTNTQDRDQWLRLLRRAGVQPYALHSARNTCAHLLEDAGAMPRVVADILGHSEVAITYRYQRGNEPAVHRAMAGLDAHLALGTGGVAA